MNSDKKNLAWGLATNYLQYFIGIFLGIILSPIVLKHAGKEVMGGYAFLLQIVSYVALVDLGIGYSATRYISQAYYNKTDFNDTISRYFTTGVIQSVLMALIFYSLSLIIPNQMDFTPEVGHQVKISMIILSISSLVTIPFGLADSILYATNNMKYNNIINLVQNLLKLLLSIFFVYKGLAIFGLIIAQVFSSILAIVIKSIIISKKLGGINLKLNFKFDNYFKEILAFSLNGFLITIAIRLVFTTDNIVIGFMYGPIAVSSYYLTMQPSRILQQLVMRITDNFFPIFNKLHITDKDKLTKNYLLILKVSYLLLIPISMGTILLTENIISLWIGVDNYIAQPMALWCGLFTFLIVLGHVPNAIIMTNGDIKGLSKFAIVEGIINLILSLILGKLIGLHGIMLATVIANVPTTTYLLLKAFKILQVDILKIFTLNNILKNIFFIFLEYFMLYYIIKITSFISLNTFVNTFLAIFLYLSLFVLLVYLLFVSKDEKSKLYQLIKLKNILWK